MNPTLPKSVFAFLFAIVAHTGCVPLRGTMPTHTWHPDHADAESCTSHDTRQVSHWDRRDRIALASMLDADRVVIVSALGCTVEVLTQCRVPGGYWYAEVGRYDLDRSPVNAAELEGDCQGATHVLSGIHIEEQKDMAFADLTPLSIAGHDLSGKWNGVMRQPHGPYQAYDVVLELQHEDQRVTGVTHVRTIDGAYWGLLKFEGRVEGNTVFFADAQLIGGNTGIFLDWCLKGGYLLADPNAATLRGPWRAFACSPGELELHRREESERPPDAVATSGR